MVIGHGLSSLRPRAGLSPGPSRRSSSSDASTDGGCLASQGQAELPATDLVDASPCFLRSARFGSHRAFRHVADATDYFFLARGLADGATVVGAAVGAPCADCAFWDFLSFCAFLSFFLAMTFS
jgi:hypothetical protein